jgi:hypothetical protein
MQDMQPDNSAMPIDNEGAMAKADLYKLANYSFKLFKQIDGSAQLEGWVQAKITKAADYIASVYHYMEYEMKFTEYGEKLENSDVYSESQKAELVSKLMEAKEKVKELKKKTADKLVKKDVPVKEEKSSTGGEIDRSKKGVTKHTHNPDRFTDEPHTEPKSQAKSRSAAEKKGDAAADKAEEKEGKNWEKRFGKGSVTRVKDGKKVDEAAKSPKAKKDYDKDGKVESEKDEVIGSRRKAAGLDEADEGKHNNATTGFKALAKKAGGGEKGAKIAGAQREKMKKAGKIKEGAKPDFLDMDKDGDKKEPMKKAVAEKKKKVKEAVAKAKAKMEGSIQGGVWVSSPDKGVAAPSGDPEGVPAKKAKSPFPSRNDPKKAADAKPGTANPAMPSRNKETVKESEDLDRLKSLTKHLLG